jgi:hypothetical protein
VRGALLLIAPASEHDKSRDRLGLAPRRTRIIRRARNVKFRSSSPSRNSPEWRKRPV